MALREGLLAAIAKTTFQGRAWDEPIGRGAMGTTSERMSALRARLSADAGPIRRLEVDCAGTPFVIAVDDGAVLLGREVSGGVEEPFVDLPQDDTVSRRHAQLFIGPDWTCAVDLGSTNGTRINGVPIAPAVEMLIRDGDVLTLGQHTHIVCRT